MSRVESSVHASAWSSWVYTPGGLQWRSTCGGWFCGPGGRGGGLVRVSVG